jgi:hypothetical protein
MISKLSVSLFGDHFGVLCTIDGLSLVIETGYLGGGLFCECPNF